MAPSGKKGKPDQSKSPLAEWSNFRLGVAKDPKKYKKYLALQQKGEENSKKN